MSKSTIFSTRRGFLYQDRAALVIFLNHFQNKNISSFYLDYPLDNQKSLDVRIKTKDGKEKIYEVKSGENFKLDKRKKSSSEVRDAIIDLNNYSKKQQQAIYHLIISKSFRPQIAEYWEKLISTKERPTLRSQRVKSATNWLFRKINIGKTKPFRNLRGFHKFCLKLNIDDFASDKLTNNSNDRYPPIEDDILQKINDILTEAGANVCKFELDEENLLYKLLCACRENAGSAKDAFPLLKSIILGFICHRRYIDKNYNPKGDNQAVKTQIDKETETWFKNWWEPKLSNVKSNQSSTN